MVLGSNRMEDILFDLDISEPEHVSEFDKLKAELVAPCTAIQFHQGSDCCCLVTVPEGYSLEGFLNRRGWEHQDTLEELGNNQYICLVSDLFEF